jgi:hypothetical protein
MVLAEGVELGFDGREALASYLELVVHPTLSVGGCTVGLSPLPG